MVLRLPTHQEIEQIVTATGANRIAVENFIDGLDMTMPRWYHLKNLVEDANLYGWRDSTVSAIRAAIDLAFK